MCVFGTCVYVYIYVYAYFLRKKNEENTDSLSSSSYTHSLPFSPPECFFLVFLSIVYLLIFPFSLKGSEIHRQFIVPVNGVVAVGWIWCTYAEERGEWGSETVEEHCTYKLKRKGQNVEVACALLNVWSYCWQGGAGACATISVPWPRHVTHWPVIATVLQ